MSAGAGRQGKIVLAYSGGLDTSVCVKWLVDRGWEVVCFMADIGQGGGRNAQAIQRARVGGASRVVMKDLRREFVEDYIWPALKADAVYEGGYLLATALSRPLIAKHMVLVAHEVGATAVGHGCTGKGNDQVRFELTSRMLDPRLKIVAPVREWEFKSRDQEIEYALSHGIPIDVTKRSSYSIDENLWGTSIESGVLEDPWVEPPADTYRSVRPVEQAERVPAYATIAFERGVPVSVNGQSAGGVALIEQLNGLAGRHGIGRSDMIESRVVGIKSREVYEAPAGTVLLAAHQELERLTLDRRLLQMKQGLAITYAELVYGGLWFTPMKTALDAFMNDTQRTVTGEVRMRLFKGVAQAAGRRSPHGLYRERLATYSDKDQFDQRAAEGFLQLYGLPYEGTASREAGTGRRTKARRAGSRVRP